MHKQMYRKTAGRIVLKDQICGILIYVCYIFMDSLKMYMY